MKSIPKLFITIFLIVLFSPILVPIIAFIISTGAVLLLIFLAGIIVYGLDWLCSYIEKYRKKSRETNPCREAGSTPSDGQPATVPGNTSSGSQTSVSGKAMKRKKETGTKE